MTIRINLAAAVVFTIAMTGRPCAADPVQEPTSRQALIIPPEHNAVEPPIESPGRARFSLREQFLYSSHPEPVTGNVRFDEWALTGRGNWGPRLDYRLEQYFLEGAQAGLTREIWLRYQITPNGRRVPVTMRVGEFTLPLPVDPKDDLQSSTSFAVWDQAVGTNPFTFFDPKIGTEMQIGRRDNGISFALDAIEGHERQNPIRMRSADTAASLRYRGDPVTATLYYYEGRRTLGNGVDRFCRTGLGVAWELGPLQIQTVEQFGRDRDADGEGTSASSSGGFVQARYAWGRHPFAVARWDITSDDLAGPAHRLVALAGWIFGDNLAITIEDRIVPGPATRQNILVQLVAGH